MATKTVDAAAAHLRDLDKTLRAMDLARVKLAKAQRRRLAAWRGIAAQLESNRKPTARDLQRFAAADKACELAVGECDAILRKHVLKWVPVKSGVQ